MWYDKYPGVPERGSYLETLFLLVMMERKDAELMATRALVLGTMADGSGQVKEAIAGFQAYCDAMFPFLQKAAEVDKNRDYERLMSVVAKPIRIDIAPTLAERQQKARTKAAQKFKIRGVEIPGVTKGKP